MNEPLDFDWCIKKESTSRNRLDMKKVIYSNSEIRWRISVLVLTLLGVILFFLTLAHGNTRIPGTDASDQLEAAGTMLRLIDTGMFKWGARLFAGICILSGGWNLKEQRFGIAIICIVAAILIGTAPMWVANIFSIGGGNGIFSSYEMKNLIEVFNV